MQLAFAAWVPLPHLHSFSNDDGDDGDDGDIDGGDGDGVFDDGDGDGDGDGTLAINLVSSPQPSLMVRVMSAVIWMFDPRTAPPRDNT